MKLTLMFRPYCGLCHAMRDQLQPYQQEFGFELCHWHLDETALRDYLQHLQAETI